MKKLLFSSSPQAVGPLPPQVPFRQPAAPSRGGENYPWTMSRIVRRGLHVLREEGARSLWFKVLGEVVYRRLEIFEFLLSRLPPPCQPLLSLEFRPLREDEAAQYVAFDQQLTVDEIQRRLRGGHQCWIALCSGSIVHGLWIAPHQAWIDYLQCEYPLADGEVYLYQSYTAPQSRGKGVASLCLQRVLHNVARAGCRRAYAAVVPENRQALVPVLRAGGGRLGFLGYYRFGARRRYFFRRSYHAESRALGEWNRVAARFRGGTDYLDPFLGEQKSKAYLHLAARWAGDTCFETVLKTDLFEEAFGPDALLPGLSERACLGVGIDVSPDIAARAAERHVGRHRAFLVADIRALPLAENSLSLVVSPSTLDHFPDPTDLGRSLWELWRVLRPGGRLIITLDNRQNIFDPLLRIAARLGLVPYYLGRSYRIGELQRELEQAGFEVWDTTAILHTPRLLSVGSFMLARRLGSRWLLKAIQRAYLSMQKLEGTRFRYFTGSFVSALAVKQS